MKKLYLSLALLVGLTTVSSTLMAPPQNTPTNNSNNNGENEWYYGMATLALIGIIGFITWNNAKANKSNSNKPKNSFETLVDSIISWLESKEDNKSSTSTTKTTTTTTTRNQSSNREQSPNTPQPTAPPYSDLNNEHLNNIAQQSSPNLNNQEQQEECLVCFEAFKNRYEQEQLDARYKNPNNPLSKYNVHYEKFGTTQSPVVTLSCNHKFCEECLKKWELTEKELKQKEKQPPIFTCPTCRKIVEKRYVSTVQDNAPQTASSFAPVFNPYAHISQR